MLYMLFSGTLKGTASQKKICYFYSMNPITHSLINFMRGNINTAYLYSVKFIVGTRIFETGRTCIELLTHLFMWFVVCVPPTAFLGIFLQRRQFWSPCCCCCCCSCCSCGCCSWWCSLRRCDGTLKK